VPLILTAQARVMCAHGGQVMLIPRQGVVTIRGAPVMCVPDVIGAPIVGCAQPPTPTTKPCTTVVSALPGSWSLTVLVGGKPVYLQTLTGMTDGVPPAPITVVYPGQELVQG
jgi:hypothetical protein